MTEKQVKIVRTILNEHINDNLELIKDLDNPHTIKSLKEENEALDEAIKVVSKATN